MSWTNDKATRPHIVDLPFAGVLRYLSVSQQTLDDAVIDLDRILDLLCAVNAPIARQ